MKGLEQMTAAEGSKIVKDIIKESHGIDVKSITVIGRRWFQKTYGNTYNTATIMVNGETVHKVGFGYGYGEMYLQRSTEWLSENGYLPHGFNYPYDAIWQYCRENGVKFESHVTDVTRKRDL